MITFQIIFPTDDSAGLNLAVAAAALEVVSNGAERARKTTSFKDRSGRTRGAITSGIQGRASDDSLEAYVRCPTVVASYLDAGTKPHTILPKNGQLLRWEQPGGGVAFARRVNHPGTRPTRFITGSVDVIEATRFIANVALAHLMRRTQGP